MACGISPGVQPYSGNTTSDHLRIVPVIPSKRKSNFLGRNPHWRVFALFSEYTFSFWEKKWDLDDLESTYDDYSEFLFLLSVRCTRVFPFDKYRHSVPLELRSFFSHKRALSFRQLRTKCRELKKHVNQLRREAIVQLKNLFSYHLSSIVRRRNTSLPAASYLWVKNKKYIKP